MVQLRADGAGVELLQLTNDGTATANETATRAKDRIARTLSRPPLVVRARARHSLHMTRPTKLDDARVAAWLAAHAGWERVGDGAIARTFKLADFSAALGFVVRVGLAAEKNDHHPDIELGWGRARVLWSTHDAGGITELDLKLAEACDSLLNIR